MPAGTTAVIVFGRSDHGDDAAGLMLADILEHHLPGELTVVRSPRAPGELQDVLRLHDTVYAIDTLHTGDTPGVVRRIDSGGDRLPASYPPADQRVSLVDVIDAADEDNGEPAVVVFGIEGRWSNRRAGISPEVAAAVHDLAGLVRHATTTGHAA